MIKAGIIGCGNIAWKWDKFGGRNFNTHAKSYYHNPNVKLKACCDINFESAKGLAQNYPGTVPCTDYKQMLRNENLDIVSVCTPISTHYKILEYILKHTNIKYIFAEKTLTLNIEQTKKILFLAKKKKVHIVVNYLRRWDDTLGKLSCIIQSNNFGRFQFGRIIYYGGIRQNCIHLIDFLHYLGFDFHFAGFLSRIKRYKNDFASSFLLKTKASKPLYFHWIDEKNYPCLDIDLFFERGRISIGDYSDVNIFQVKKSNIYPDFRELVLTQQIPSTICTSMKYAVDHIVRQCQAGAISYEPLERELKLMKFISQIEQNINRKDQGITK